MSKQRYLCLICGKQFQSKNRKEKLHRVIWKKFVWERKTIKNLCKEYHRSKDWIRKHLKLARVNIQLIKPQSAVFIADATFFKRKFGIVVFRIPCLQRNIYWQETLYETISDYQQGRIDLEKQGFKFQAIVLDGRPGVRAVFSDIPVQMCHYHQKQIINRYLTTRPKLQASIELRNIVQFLCHSNEKIFTDKLNHWHEKWIIFLKEKTINEEKGKWFYKHKRIRSAYRSLKANLPYLFTYQEYPQLNIPNTTNSLDGYFSHLKELVKIHRGLNSILKRKLIDEILGK